MAYFFPASKFSLQMAGQIKIGFLTLYSGGCLSYSGHLTAGILPGFCPTDINQGEFQFAPVYSKQGEAREFCPLSGFSLPEIDILKIRTSANKTFNRVISRGSGPKFDLPDFKSIHEGCVSGWQNPYLCI
jgi:hypothetical protein